MNLSWTAVTHDDLKGYRIYFDTQPGIGGGEETVDVENGTVNPPTSVRLTGLTDCTDYYCSVRAYDAAGHFSDGYSNEVSGFARPRLQSATPATGQPPSARGSARTVAT